MNDIEQYHAIIANNMKVEPEQIQKLFEVIKSNIPGGKTDLNQIADFVLKDFFTNSKMQDQVSLLATHGVQEKTADRFYQALRGPVGEKSKRMYRTTNQTTQRILPVL